jgi:hypothetical protein
MGMLDDHGWSVYVNMQHKHEGGYSGCYTWHRCRTRR